MSYGTRKWKRKRINGADHIADILTRNVEAGVLGTAHGRNEVQLEGRRTARKSVRENQISAAELGAVGRAAKQ